MNKYLPLLVLFLTLTILASCNQNPKEQTSDETIIIVGTNAEFAPFSFIENGEIQGFEIDLSKEICHRLGYQLLLKDLPFEALIPALNSQKVDIIAAGMSTTAERELLVDFSIPYLDGSPLCLVYSNKLFNNISIESLDSMKVVVNDGYTADFYVTDTLGITPIRLSNPVDAILALKAKRADVFITAKDTVSPLLKHDINMDYSVVPIDNTSENCAIMLPKGSSELKLKINKTLQEMKDDSTILNLKKKWGLL